MRIAITGAGPGGLTLARVLHQHGIDAAAVYERDTGRTTRTQGGTLDLHPDTGQRALRDAGLEAEFLAVARRESQDLRLLDKHGTIRLDQHTPDDAPLIDPEVDRADLRDILLDSLPATTVHWGHELTHATPLGDGRHRLHFADGTTTETDLLIGADGANSRIRPLLTDAEPRPTGRQLLETQIPDIDRTHPELAAVIGRGNYWALDAGRSLSAQRNSDGRARVYVSVQAPTELPAGDPATIRAGIAKLFHDWAPGFHDIIDACEDTFLPRKITVLPVDVTWPGTPGVTLLGDAAHLMPPVGRGANLAMLDALELGLTIAAGKPVRDYETAMFHRGGKAARRSAQVNEIVAAGAEATLAFFQGHDGGR
ncbi:NAD(P)/FAD-dependent oxidoreductase [Amycolatopsis sp.]|uniref:FAD-dependent oxidoreductase n=1 Tax=Amycolatopsis sp. TaxID=37632 RepID=UPI002CDA58C1|nr:NAD(P)/FAD-dependent oxidoreductase [Amycolatopsis sp.]HVV07662.1 NAD(P)/FAD-dependent oxidoreductase [Amycolatopsis sp.]